MVEASCRSSYLPEAASSPSLPEALGIAQQPRLKLYKVNMGRIIPQFSSHDHSNKTITGVQM